ncbi:hypothetical protein Tco_0221202 [Tanacetum coccineum]
MILKMLFVKMRQIKLAHFAYAKIPKLYRAYELCDKNEQLHVFDSEETLEDAEKSQLKMNEFQKDEKIQELKIQPIDYEKLNKLYKEFVPQKQLSEPSVKQTCSSPYSIPFVKILETKTMPSELPLINELFNIKVGFEKLSLLIHQNSKRESIFYTSNAEIERNDFCREKVKPLLNELQNQNDLLKDQLLEASLTEDIKNLVITSCVEIRNKDLHDEIERISKESKDVSNESKTVDTACNDAFEVKQELSKRIIELEKDFAKRKWRILRAHFKLENAHLKQTYKDLFESVQRSKVEIKQCDEVKVKDDFDEIETKKHLSCENIDSIDELEKSLAKQIKENSDLLIKIDNLENVFADEEKRATLGKLNAFDNENCDFESKVIHLEKIIAQKSKDFDDVNLELSNRTAKFEAYFEKLEKTKVVLERQLARKVDDSKAEKDRFLKEINHLRTQLENLKGKRVETKLDNSSILGKPPLLNNERDQLLKQIASLESKLASQDIRSCQKEYHELRTSYNALKVKFDSLNRKKWNINVSKSSKPKESVSEKVHTGESSKTSLRRVSQFTTYSLQKDRKFSKKSQSFETFFPQKGFKTRASNAKNQSFETSHFCFTPVKQVWRPIKESQTFEASTSQKSFKTSTFKGKNQVFVTPHSRFTPVKQVWRPKQSHSKSFKYSKIEMLLMQNKNDSVLKNKNSGRFSNGSKMNLQNNTPIVNNKWKSSSSTRFKHP